MIDVMRKMNSSTTARCDMKRVNVLVGGRIVAGIHNIKAGLVSYVMDGRLMYVGCEWIVPALLSKQAF